MIFGFVAKHRGIWPVAFFCEALGAQWVLRVAAAGPERPLAP